MTTSIESLNGTTSRVLVGGVEAFRFTTAGIDKVQDASITAAKLAAAVVPLGVGQTWQSVGGSRAFGTTYTNSTGRPIMVYVSALNAAAGNCGFQITVDGLAFAYAYDATTQAAGNTARFLSAVVLPGSTYSVGANINVSIGLWWELR